MISKLQNLWRKLTTPRATDEDEARREYFVNVILAGAGAIGLVYTLVIALAYCTMTEVPPPTLLAGVLTLPLSPLGLWLSRRGRWRVAALVPLLGLLSVTIYGRYHFGQHDVTIVLYGALVIIAGIVYGGRVAAGATVISVLSYVIVGWLQLQGLVPSPGGVGLLPKVAAIGASLGIIVVLQWLFTSQLQEALRESRTYAQELSKHRERLEELVEERTAALSVANAQLQQKIAEGKRAEAELRKYQEHLEELVEERTTDLRESEERYRTLFDGVPVGLYRTTPAGQVLDANLAGVQMLSYPSREELLAISSASLYVDPEERARWQALMEREGVVRDFETQMYKHNGTVIWVNNTARAVRDEGGQVLYYEGSIEDITERKRAEAELRRYQEHLEELVEERTAELRESEERYRTLFDGVPVGLYRTTPEGEALDFNLAVVQMLGYPSRDAVLGITTDDVYADAEDRVRWQALMEREGVVRDFEARLRRHDGTVIWVSDTARAVKDEQGQVLYYEGSLEDITERKRAEEELRQAKEAAEAANQAKSTFLANMSHELRTPLNAILGFTQLMDGDPNLTAAQRENLGIINRSGEHLLALINDVLEMSKIEAGRVTLQEKSFDLYRLLDTLEEMFRLRTEDKSLALIFDRASDVPQYVRTDESKLRQVLMNLLSNAVKFTEEGGIALRVARVIEEGRLIFEVEDTGPGIAPEELEGVFEPFVQTASGQRSLEGTGLGLSISRQFARLMGGDITVSSQLGQGSVFKFEVPIGLTDAAEVRVARPPRQVLGLEPDQEIYRLLIVDDRETTRRLLVNLLEPLGFEVREAVNGQEALEMWERWEPHLIWMDMRMPVMDGYEATRRIKATAKGQATVIVALTASAFEEDRETIVAAGCDDVVRKPFRKEEIFDMLTKHLGVRFAYGEGEAEPTALPLAEVRELLTPEALAALPADWLADVQQATIKADLNLILTLVDQIREQNATLADALADLAHDFEYKKILTLIQQAGEQE